MKIDFKSRSRSAYALVIVLVMALVAMMILGGTLRRTYGVAYLNSRAVDMMSAQNAAEAALEMVFANIQYDFQSAGGMGMVSNHLALYRGMYPTSSQDPYWGNFQFSDAQGTVGKTCVYQVATFSGPLPTAYSNRSTYLSPVYRIVSNAKPLRGSSGAIGTAQEDVLLALIPLTDFAIFYNGLLEFSTCATMVVNGAVHSNTNIYVGAGSGATLTFNTVVTASGIVEAPPNNGQNWGSGGQITNFYSGWRTTFNPTNFDNGLATIQISIPMTNTYNLIDVPTNNDSATVAGQVRLYNLAQVVLSVSNLNATDPYTSNVVVSLKVQKASGPGVVPGADTMPTILTFTNPSPSVLSSNFPYLTFTNFYDIREKTTNLTSQVDIALYRKWLTNSTSPVVGKFPADGSSGYPTILFVNDTRNTTTLGGKKLDVVRLKNGTAPPPNGGLGFTVATPNPLYVWGDYNQTNSTLLGTTNTQTGTVPCALMGDALTILSSAWNDVNSYTAFDSTGAWNANDATINAAILTGIVPSTGSDNLHFSGGVHNLPRLLEDWSGNTLTLNTSIINLFNSTKAKGQFLNPGTYYKPPTRKFSYDNNFSDPSKVPPGIPCALVALRYNWATPPPNTINYNVRP